MLKVVEDYLLKYTILSREEIKAILTRTEIRSFRKRERLISIGEREQYLNLVISGIVRKFLHVGNGKDEIVTQLAKEGDFISCSVSFFSDQPSHYSIEALEKVQVISISKEKVNELMTMGIRMERLVRLVITNLYLQKEEIEYEHIQSDVRERIIKFAHERSEFLHRIPQKYIASYLNINPETFSRLKHLLKKPPVIAG